MKSENQLKNELSQRTNYLRQLSEEESLALKQVIFSIYIDVSALCDENNLVYMLSGGSCLGAVRHQGFIPWDDDMDIMMPRKDYETLISLLNQGKLGPKYEFTSPSKCKDANTVFLKIFRKNSLNVELHNFSTPFPKGIYMDVFPIDSVPHCKLARRIKGFFADSIQFIGISCLYAQYPSKELKEFMSMDFKLYRKYWLKVILGHIFSFASYNTWVYCFDKFVKSSKSINTWGIPTGRKYYCGEIFDKEVFVPVSKGIFEGVVVNLPNNTDKYLKNLYNNYMQLPPVEKRERHFICKFKLPDE